jgi:hypothetical protein
MNGKKYSLDYYENLENPLCSKVMLMFYPTLAVSMHIPLSMEED